MTTETPTTDPATGWTLCTIEDASLPGQEFPCMWNAQIEGNGEGCSFVLDFAGDVPHYVTDVLADGSVLTDDAGCAPYSGDEDMTNVSGQPPAAEPVLTAPTSEPVAQTLAAPAPAHAELAETGWDPVIGLCAAALMVVVGAVLVRADLRSIRRSK